MQTKDSRQQQLLHSRRAPVLLHLDLVQMYADEFTHFLRLLSGLFFLSATATVDVVVLVSRHFRRFGDVFVPPFVWSVLKAC